MQRILRGICSKCWPGVGLHAFVAKADFGVDADGTGPHIPGAKAKIAVGTTVHWGRNASAMSAEDFLRRLAEGDRCCKAWTEAGITDNEIDESRAALMEWKATRDAWYLGIHTGIGVEVG